MAADSPPTFPKARRRRTRLALGCVGVLGIILSATVVVFAVWRARLRSEVNARVAAIRAAGLPTIWEELSEWPTNVPDAENAALIYTNAIAQIKSNSIPKTVFGGAQFQLPRRGEPLSDEVRGKLRSAIETNALALRAAYAAMHLSKSRYPVNYLDGPNATLPHLSGLGDVMKLLEFDALLHGDAGDSAAATKAVEASLAVARSLDGEPVLISQLRAVATLDVSCLSLERVLCRIPLNDDQLRLLSGQLVAAEATNRFVAALVGERASYMEFLRLAQDDVRQMIEIANKGSQEEEKTELPSRNPGLGWRALGFFERDRNFFLRAMETNLAVAATAPPASLAMTNEINRIVEQARDGYYILSGLFLPSFSRVAQRDAFLRARLRVAITTLAVERWRLAHKGAMPGSLNDLVPALLPAVPLDPFDGQPLRFKKLARGYVVYSIGPDQQDDGGKERPLNLGKLKPDQRQFDLTFTVER